MIKSTVIVCGSHWIKYRNRDSLKLCIHFAFKYDVKLNTCYLCNFVLLVGNNHARTEDQHSSLWHMVWNKSTNIMKYILYVASLSKSNKADVFTVQVSIYCWQRPWSTFMWPPPPPRSRLPCCFSHIIMFSCGGGSGRVFLLHLSKG